MGGALAAGVCARHPEVRGLAVVNPLVDPPAPAFLETLEAFLAAGERYLPGIGSDIADPSAREVAYDRLPVAALLSMGRGLHDLRPQLAGVRCPVLILTSRHDHVVPAVSSDVLAEAVSGPVERLWLEQRPRGHPGFRPEGAGAPGGCLRLRAGRRPGRPGRARRRRCTPR